MSHPKRILFPGTFDPITLGHLDVIEQAKRCFDEVVIAISAHNITKNLPLFSCEERLTLAKRTLSSLSGVEVITFSGLTIDAAQDCGATAILRGVRNATDFDYESTFAQTNREMAPKITTIFVLPKPEVAHISSTIVREIAKLGGDFNLFVPNLVGNALREKLSKGK